MAASNKDSDSELSDKVHAKTTDEVVSAPKDVRVTGVTPSTVTLQWSILNFTQPCLDIRGYEILYRRTYPRPEKMGKVIAVDSNKKEIEYPIKNLWQKTNFSIQYFTLPRSSPNNRAYTFRSLGSIPAGRHPFYAILLDAHLTSG
ncbi:uncharacterized protein LOC115918208 [Strongylocentrotus purpuratus]|uniref:Fibronectin type-III domain-containing protein n=1 Tax=Strongylocentrotus purpuratus TaxID=7668 RepID=A0A7M7PKL4_STRPU|nr:uncharacterized protein LOC115918208 [Strongylocentrotus purpuratus]